MRRERNEKGLQRTLWEDVIPGYTLEDDPELQRIDALLDDEAFMEPFRRRLTSMVGRPTIPLEVYLRLMYLRRRHGLSYEDLVREVADSLRWRRFCRLGLDQKLPDRSTLIKLTGRLGPELLEELHQALMTVCVREKMVRGRQAKVDCTVTAANIHPPTDTTLLADGVRVVTRLVRRLQKAVGDRGKPMRDRSRSTRHEMSALQRVRELREGASRAAVVEATHGMVGVAARVLTDAQRVLRRLRERVKAVGDQAVVFERRATEMVNRLVQVREQTIRVLDGVRSIPERVVSLFDPDARPIRRGKAGKRTEFGSKVLLVESEERIVTVYRVFRGAPADTGLLRGAIDDHRRAVGHLPKVVATDRGFYSAENEQMLAEQGVQRISIPKRGRKTAERTTWEKRRSFVRLQHWRAGQEATISELSRVFGLSRSPSRGLDGVRIHDGWAILAYNLRRIGRLAAAMTT